MPILVWIVATTLVGGVLSVVAAAAFALRARPAQVSMLISYAIGTLLGAAFLEILPHAFELSPSAERVSATVLVGILLFFLLEKLMLWRHRHEDAGEEQHDHGDHGRIATMVIVGDTFHNFVDGVIIAAAFLTDTHLGIVTALAIIAHEIPQEVGDFAILLHSGYSRVQAFKLNIMSSFASVAGGVLGYFTLQTMQSWTPTLLALAAASLTYVSVADLIPGLHKRVQLRDTLEQVGLIALGVATVGGMGMWLAE